MSVWDKMKEITSGNKSLSEESTTSTSPVAKHGDTIKGVITNIVKGNEKKNGGYGFITSPSLPYERIFFHWQGLHQHTLRFPELKRRMKVEFRLQYDQYNGYSAVKVKVID